MANLTENPIYEPGIFQLEKTTPPLGGAPAFNGPNPSAGHANVQGLQLANRTAWLKQYLENLQNNGSRSIGFLNPSSLAVNRTLNSKLSDVVSAKDFGLVGDGSDETNKLQAAIDASEGKILIFEAGKTYGYSSIRFKKNTNVITSNSTFKRLAASTSSGITFEENITIDSLYISTPGGSGGDRSVRLLGSNFRVGTISVIADDQGVYNSPNSAIDIGSNPVGTLISNINIGNIITYKVSSALTASYVDGLVVNGIVSRYYRTAVYLKDVSRSSISNVLCEFLGAAVDGRPGENGLLIESSLSSGSSHSLVFDNWDVRDSGEHAYRLGGQLAIKGVWFDNCIATRPGSSILSGNLTSGEWHGGCGFKVLGGNTTTTEYHEDIFFKSCGVIDCNITYGSYPAAHGVNNFQPWLVVMAKNVHLDNCWTKAVGQAYVSRYGILTTSSDGVFLTSCNFRSVQQVPLRPYEETPVNGYPGSDGPLVNFYVNGGLFEVQEPTPGAGLGLYMQSVANYNHKNWILEGVRFKGGAGAYRIEPPNTGSFVGMVFNFIYSESNVNDSTYTTPVGAGTAVAIVNATAPWRPLAFSPSAVNGSQWTSSNDGFIRTRLNGTWNILRSRYDSSDIMVSWFATVPVGQNDTTGLTNALNYAFTNNKTLVIDVDIHTTRIAVNSGTGAVVCTNGRIFAHSSTPVINVYDNMLLDFKASVVRSKFDLVIDLQNLGISGVFVRGPTNTVSLDIRNSVSKAGQTFGTRGLLISGDFCNIPFVRCTNFVSVPEQGDGASAVTVAGFAKSTQIGKIIAEGGGGALLNNGNGTTVELIYSDGCLDNVVYDIEGAKDLHIDTVKAINCPDEIVVFNRSQRGRVENVVATNCGRGVGVTNAIDPSIGTISWRVDADSTLDSGSPLYARSNQTEQTNSLTVGRLEVRGTWKNGAPLFTFQNFGIKYVNIGEIDADISYTTASATKSLSFFDSLNTTIDIGQISVVVRDGIGTLTSSDIFTLNVVPTTALGAYSSIGGFRISNGGGVLSIRVPRINDPNLAINDMVRIRSDIGTPFATNEDDQVRVRIFYSGTAPTTGSWVRGDIVLKTTPSASGFAGWECVASGTPGTWKDFAAIAP